MGKDRENDQLCYECLLFLMRTVFIPSALLHRFNRTGLMLCSYLIEEQKYSVSEALVHFQETRPPKGIR